MAPDSSLFSALMLGNTDGQYEQKDKTEEEREVRMAAVVVAIKF